MSEFTINNNDSKSSLSSLSKEDKSEDKRANSKRISILDRLMSSRRLKSKSPSISPSASFSSKSTRDSRSIQDSLPPLSPLKISGYSNSTKRRLINEELASNIRNLLPGRLQLFENWELVYSMEQHGISLNTLYQNCNPEYQIQKLKKEKIEKGYGDSIINSMIGNTTSFNHKRPHGYVMIVEDENHSKFGCFLNEHLRPMDHKRYYGNGECFLWKCESCYVTELTNEKSIATSKTPSTRFKAYMYTGVNDNIIYSNHDFIAIGSSNGQNALWIDKSLYQGVSYACDTFGNEILTNTSNKKIGKFHILALEVWRVGNLE